MKKKDGIRPGFLGVAGVIVEEVREASVKKALASGADFFEVRVDTFKHRDPEALKDSLIKLRSVEGASRLPILLTIRSRKEGGAHEIPDKRRLELFDALTPFSDIVDIELSSGTILKNVVNFARRGRKRVIISYHNFKTTPGVKALQDIIRRGRDSGGDIIKIAAFAKGPEDLKRLAKTLCESEGLIVIAMGSFGAVSRVFFPFLGSIITYGSITRPTAPGQLSLKTLKKELALYGF